MSKKHIILVEVEARKNEEFERLIRKFQRKVKNEKILEEINIGKDGLICQYNKSSGLLLPQVATENKMNAKEFLDCVCNKAGLPQNTWKKPECKIYKFQAQIFLEKSPNGEVKEEK